MDNYTFIMNDQFTIREEDKALFSLASMEIYKFNEMGYRMLSEMKAYGPLTISSWKSRCKEKFQIDESDFNYFIEKLISKDIILQYN